MRLISVISFNLFPMFANGLIGKKFFADLITRRFETNLNGIQ